TGRYCCSPIVKRVYEWPSMNVVPYLHNPYPQPNGTGYSGRSPMWEVLHPKFKQLNDSYGAWFPAGYADFLYPPERVLAAAFGVWNRTTYLGGLSVCLNQSAVTDLLTSQTLSPNAFVFLIDGANGIVATSHPTPFSTITEYPVSTVFADTARCRSTKVTHPA